MSLKMTLAEKKKRVRVLIDECVRTYEMEDAVELGEYILSLDGEDASSKALLGSLFVGWGRAGRALALLEREPREGVLGYWYGRACVEGGREEEGRAVLEKLIERGDLGEEEAVSSSRREHVTSAHLYHTYGEVLSRWPQQTSEEVSKDTSDVLLHAVQEMPYRMGTLRRLAHAGMARDAEVEKALREEAVPERKRGRTVPIPKKRPAPSPEGEGHEREARAQIMQHLRRYLRVEEGLRRRRGDWVLKELGAGGRFPSGWEGGARAVGLLHLGRKREGGMAFRRWRDSTPWSLRWAGEYGRYLWEEEEEGLVLLLSWVRKVEGETGDGWEARGWAAWHRGKEGEAVEAFREGSSSDSLVACGEVYEAGGDGSGAAACFHAALLLDKGAYRAWAGLGRVRGSEGLGDEAALMYRSALEEHPRDVGSLLGLGQLYEGMDEGGKAIALYRTGLQHLAEAGVVEGQAQRRVRGQLGLVLCREGLWEEGRDVWQGIVTANNQDGEGHYRLGLACVEIGDVQSGQEHLLIAASGDWEDAHLSRRRLEALIGSTR